MTGFFKQRVLELVRKSGYVLLPENDSRLWKAHKIEARALKYLVKPNQPVCFDIGAHKGETIEAWKSLFDTPRIHSFEPTEEACEKLEMKFGDDVNVTLNNLALSDFQGQTDFYEQTRGNFNSVHPMVGGENEKKEVAVDTLDNYCIQHGIEYIDLLKSDTQGNDVSVLKGGQRILQNTAVVEIEILVGDTYGHNTSIKDIEDCLPDFQLFDITKKVCYSPKVADEIPQKNHPKVGDVFMSGHVSWMNAIYFNRNFYN